MTITDRAMLFQGLADTSAICVDRTASQRWSKMSCPRSSMSDSHLRRNNNHHCLSKKVAGFQNVNVAEQVLGDSSGMNDSGEPQPNRVPAD